MYVPLFGGDQHSRTGIVSSKLINMLNCASQSPISFMYKVYEVFVALKFNNVSSQLDFMI